MSDKGEKKALVPKLRFPEFAEAGDWEEKRLGDVVDVIDGDRGKNYPKVNEFSSSGFCLFLNAKNVTKGGFSFKKMQFITQKKDDVLRKGKLQREDIILTTRGSVGHFSYFSKEVPFNNIRINSGMVILRIKSESLIPDYLYVFCKSENMSLHIEDIAFGNAQQQLTVAVIKIFLLTIPTPPEQQKIAACLSSLDDLITVQGQKLETLKSHKKGLMQQLFPQKGQTTPQRRFPEFAEAGEWEEKTLGKSLLQHPEYGINAPAVPFNNNLPTYLRITDISEDGCFLPSKKVSVAQKVTNENYLIEGDIVLARTGASVGKSYKYREKDGRLVFAGFLIRIRPDKEKLNSEFLFQFLTTEQYWHWVSFISMRSGQPGINGNEYSSLSFAIPTLLEQQKIAACLSSLDDLITAQSQKIETLKTHKKGLMQQLFPNPE